MSIDRKREVSEQCLKLLKAEQITLGEFVNYAMDKWRDIHFSMRDEIGKLHSQVDTLNHKLRKDSE